LAQAATSQKLCVPLLIMPITWMDLRFLCAWVASVALVASAKDVVSYSTPTIRGGHLPQTALLSSANLVTTASADGPDDNDAETYSKLVVMAGDKEYDLQEELAGVMSLSAQPQDVELSPSNVEKMEAAVTDLVTKADSSTPMGDSVKKIKSLITDTMLPKVKKAHAANQKELGDLAREVDKCSGTKNSDEQVANLEKTTYLRTSPLHKNCRAREASLATEAMGCEKRISATKQIRDLKCSAAAAFEKSWGTQNKNTQIVEKGAGETPRIYMKRVHDTFCGETASVFDRFAALENDCHQETEKYKQLEDGCKSKMFDYKSKVAACNNIQSQMDGAACNRAVLIKDACENYAECYHSRSLAFLKANKVIQEAEKDRKAEWRSLQRMVCLIDNFKDGKVKKQEIRECKAKTHETFHLDMIYPTLAGAISCVVPDRYPATAAYKKAEFAPLPALAKGNVDANECYGVLEISTKPKAGSPAGCKCQRVTMNGPFSAGALVKCQECLDVRRSNEKNSCPEGTKLFSPRSRTDWHTFLASATPLHAPDFIVDITRPQSGCAGCANSPMNFKDSLRQGWMTRDGSPWWLRSTTYTEPSGDYEANCYLKVTGSFTSENSLQFNANKCNIHSSSYFCQQKWMSTAPKPGSPAGCSCARVELTGRYSPGALLKCTGCTRVSKTEDKDSCPEGTKLFSPRSREDWKTVLDSAGPLRSPAWIVDVTRPENGCAGCVAAPMNFEVPEQATWRTQDGSPWWLRSTKYSEPNGDYKANCYMDLWHNPNNADSITFNDKDCRANSDAYYCQPRQTLR